jgi:putative RNA 2'-phosphotransferase
MNSKKEVVRISRFLSLVLRHQPQAINLTLDENGWASVPELLNKLNAEGFIVDFDGLQQVVETNTKKRFAFNEDKTMIRASQGHSIMVDLGFEKKEPPAVLYHGTAAINSAAISKGGLLKQSRLHVHLSADMETALKVGQRHGRPVVFEVSAKEMYQQGYGFYLSENGVWLTDFVPADFLRLLT